MNKQQAAEFLGVSIRALERYTQQGKVSVRYQQGKTRPVAVYDEQELKAFKKELQSNLYPQRPSVKQDKLANTAHSLASLSHCLYLADFKPCFLIQLCRLASVVLYRLAMNFWVAPLANRLSISGR